MTLLINTTNPAAIFFALVDCAKPKQFSRSIAYRENGLVASMLRKFLSQNAFNQKHLDQIVVCTGPGSFSGVRVGVALAQGLALAWSIPLHGLPSDQFPQSLSDWQPRKFPKKLELTYGHPVQITLPKALQ